MTKKRANGEGSITRRKNGTWQGQVTIAPRDLQPGRRATVYGKTQREVRDKMVAVRAAAANGVSLPGTSPRLRDFGRTFLEEIMPAEVARGHARESTVLNYTALWRVHIEPKLGHLRLEDLTVGVLRSWSADLASTRSLHTRRLLAHGTQERIFATLRAALNRAVNEGVVASNPLTKVRPPRGERPVARHIEDADLRELLRATEGSWLQTLIVLMVVTGARPGEALAARWDDLDLDGATWTIRRTLTRKSEGGRTALGFGQTKTPRSTDTIVLPQVAVEALRRHRTSQSEQRTARGDWADLDLIFTTRSGGVLEPRNVLRTFKRVAQGVGLTGDVCLHHLRHTAASALLEEGVSITATSKLLRHSRLATTADLYTHLTSNLRSDAALAMDGRLRRLANG